MSVLKSKRKVSNKEYEHSFLFLYKYTLDCTIKISKRKRIWIGEPIDKIMCLAYNDVLNISDVFAKRGEKEIVRKKYAKRAIDDLFSLRKPMLVLWNINMYEVRRMAYWVELLKKEIKLLYEILEEDANDIDFPIIEWDQIKRAEFIKNISDLHRTIHSKIIHVPNCYDSSISKIVIDLIDDALYSVFMANRRIPKTNSEANERKMYISNAITDLSKLQIPLTSLFNIMLYSNNVQKDIMEKLTVEIKLLKGLLRSDRSRFKDC